MDRVKRNTRQRKAIRRVLMETNRPLSPQEILEAAAVFCTGLGIATVYRTVKALLDEGFLVAVELPGQPDRFETSGKAHHHHFHCRGCGSVFEVDECPDAIHQMAPPDFVVEDHDLLFYGRCPTCAA